MSNRFQFFHCWFCYDTGRLKCIHARPPGASECDACRARDRPCPCQDRASDDDLDLGRVLIGEGKKEGDR